ncbi:adenosylhomocysteinase [Microbispora bryophytorum]|uniref:adenosylhomocysteinase n=1 Tax=Microbispora bryophytorum TaxID=1460882 RepID=UPI00340F47DF
MLEAFEKSRVDSFFRRVSERVEPAGTVSTMVITHLLAERPVFLNAISRVSRVVSVLPKPKSIHDAALREVAETFHVDRLDRARFSDPVKALTYLESRAPGDRIVLLDVGGYFAGSLEFLCDRFSGQIVGVVEDTENGHQRYVSLGKSPCPIYSVARSPLKEPEDFLVGQSVTFSTEALIRARGDILQGRPAAVIGYGKLGRSIASALHAKHVEVTVYDSSHVRRAQAMSQGYRTSETLAESICGAGAIVCATGNLSLRSEDFARIRNGAYVASVTSSDDELELDALQGQYERTQIEPHITRYSRTGHYFYVLADGNAVNFIHGAAVGPFIFLVQAEILAALSILSGKDHEPGIYEVPDEVRQAIAATWLNYFNGAS